VTAIFLPLASTRRCPVPGRVLSQIVLASTKVLSWMIREYLYRGGLSHLFVRGPRGVGGGEVVYSGHIGSLIMSWSTASVITYPPASPA